MRRRPFLTARWQNLALFTYPVRSERLRGYLPPGGGLELDTRNGQAFVSLVAFDFLDTRVFGCRWPGYRNFPELNLRFYVRHGGDRGVMFIREYVQSRLIAWIANSLYHENYRVAAMRNRVEQDSRTIRLRLEIDGPKRAHALTVSGRKPGAIPPLESTEHFFKEHRWGFGKDRQGRLLRYEVEHPAWETYTVGAYSVDLDWSDLYGPEWAFLQGETPCSVVFAAGSEVAVYPKEAASP